MRYRLFGALALCGLIAACSPEGAYQNANPGESGVLAVRGDAEGFYVVYKGQCTKNLSMTASEGRGRVIDYSYITRNFTVAFDNARLPECATLHDGAATTLVFDHKGIFTQVYYSSAPQGVLWVGSAWIKQ